MTVLIRELIEQDEQIKKAELRTRQDRLTRQSIELFQADSKRQDLEGLLLNLGLYDRVYQQLADIKQVIEREDREIRTIIETVYGNKRSNYE